MVLTSGVFYCSDICDQTHPFSAHLVGFTRTMVSELGDKHIILADVSSQQRSVEMVSAVQLLLQSDSSVKEEFALRYDKRYVNRFHQADNIDGVAHTFKQAVLGCAPSTVPTRVAEATSYCLEYDPLRRKAEMVEKLIPMVPPPGFVVVRVMACGLNFHDSLVVLGVLSPDLPQDIGAEFAGVVEAVASTSSSTLPPKFKVGDRVLVLGVGGYGNRAMVLESKVVKIADNTSFEDAASIAVAFTTVYMGLVERARIKAGETVLIHSAAGGVGLAAIQICKLYGCKVVATVSSEAKRTLMSLYNVDHILSSRSSEFELQVQALGGVDIVLNSLRSPLLEASLRCLRCCGRFVEIGKTDIFGNGKISLTPFQKSIDFISLHLDVIDHHETVRALEAVMQLVAENKIHPLPASLYPVTASHSALITMSQGSHIGKLISVTDMDRLIKVEPHRRVHSIKKTGAYVVLGGLGGIGISAVEFLASQGAGCVVPISRTGTPDAPAKCQKIEAATGCKVSVLRLDVARSSTTLVAEELKKATVGFEVMGVLHGAMVLRDKALLHMSPEDIDVSTEPKICAAWNTLEAVRMLGHHVEWFCSLSSVSAVLGGPGQSGYSSGNTFLDFMQPYLYSKGIDCWSFNLGPVSDVGFVAQTDGRTTYNRGFLPLTSREVLEKIFGCVLCVDTPQNPPASSLIISPVDASTLFQHPFVKAAKRFALLDEASSHGGATSGAINLKEMASDEDLLPKVVKSLTIAVSSVLPVAEVPINKPLTQLGVDSLVTIELRQKIFSLLNVDISVVTLLQGPTIAELAESIVASTKGGRAAASGGGTAGASQSGSASGARGVGAARGDTSKLPRQGHVSAQTLPDGTEVKVLEIPANQPVVPPVCSLVCFPFITGSEVHFEGWRERLPASVELIVVTSSRHGLLIGPEVIAALARFYSSRTGPMPKFIVPFGHSMGCLSAFAVAWRYHCFPQERQCIPPPHGIIISALPPPESDFFLRLPPRLIQQELGSVFSNAYQMKNPALDLPMLVLWPSGDPSNTIEHYRLWREYTTSTNFNVIAVPGPHLSILTHLEQPTTYIGTFVNQLN
eukprot:TRINITY_DN2545_c0_g1_i6.p1 TRINITY_DN2545_c0_g1~~TRINITY_DN2545_c0_g1_i6.p1  ORF type:complete len:1120 (+),score=169.48 TRINITY_DN2545_c0_g1_i6:118-3360(+)